MGAFLQARTRVRILVARTEHPSKLDSSFPNPNRQDRQQRRWWLVHRVVIMIASLYVWIVRAVFRWLAKCEFLSLCVREGCCNTRTYPLQFNSLNLTSQVSSEASAKPIMILLQPTPKIKRWNLHKQLEFRV